MSAEPVPPVEAFLAKLERVRRNGTGWQARCPAHEDSAPSLSVGEGDDDRVLVTCHAGCTTDAILDALGLTLADLFAPKSSNGAKRMNIVATYDNVDEHGELLYQVVRTHPKDFRQRRPDGKGGWLWRLGTIRRVPYRLPQVLEAVDAGRWVVIVEGEKDVHTLEEHGIVATTNAQGAGKWRREFAAYLKGAKVAVIPDNDAPGQKHADAIAESLRGIAAKVVRFAPPSREPGGDVTDWLNAQEDRDAAAAELKQNISREPIFIPPEARATAQPLPPTPASAPAIAYETRILDLLRDEVRLRGLVGEERNAATLYLALTSRLLERQVSVGVKGHSSSGKSYTVETVVKFFPDDQVIEFTAMSERALVYSDRDFQHRTLIIYEVVALREGTEDNLTAYFVRSLLSEGRINYEVTVRDKEGGFTTKTITKEGPTNLLFTTTQTRVHAENETRVLSLNTDDSSDQTRRVFVEIANEANGGRDLAEWLELQRWLATAEHRVTIPYAGRLAEAVPPVAVRLRRDFGALLSLIRAHAMLHQATRDRDDKGHIVATIDDYAVVRDLVADTITAGVEATVPPTVRETVAAVAALTVDGGVMARAVADHLGLDRSNASRRLRMAADGGYVRNLEDKRGRPARWVLGDPMPEDTELLPQPRNLDPHETADQASDCAVARDPGGIETPADWPERDELDPDDDPLDPEWERTQIAALDPDDSERWQRVADIRAVAARARINGRS